MAIPSPPLLPAVPNDLHKRALLELLIPHILSTHPSRLCTLLQVSSRLFREVLLSNIFGKVHVEIPVDISSSSLLVSKKVHAILKYPDLAKHVRELRFSHPTTSSDKSKQTAIYDLKREHVGEDERLALWDFSARLVDSCTRLVSFEWNLGFGVDRPLWDSIGSATALKHLRITHPGVHPNQDPLHTPGYPRISPKQPLAWPPDSPDYEGSTTNTSIAPVPDSTGWGLGPGWESLETLQLGPLSETGVKVVSAHLKSPHCTNVQRLSLESHLLDALLCQSISKLGSKGVLTHVELSSSGTRLTAELLKGIVEGCVSLESLKLNDVEGHLSKNTWSMIEDWPSRFSSLEIVIKDYIKHKSWALDHLASLHEVPFHQLQHFAVRRSVHPVNLLPYPPASAISASSTCGMELKAIPEPLFETVIANGNQLESLCLDWWDVSGQGLLAILSTHPNLKTVEMAVSAPLTSIVSNMPKTLSTSALEKLVLTTDPVSHPSTQSIIKNRTPYLDLADSDVPEALLDKVMKPDPNLPDIKDLRKLAGRLPHLFQLVSTGSGGRGCWTFNRKPKSSLIGVSFVHSAVITQDLWEQCHEPAPIYDYSDVIETRPSITGLGLETSAKIYSPSNSVPSTPVLTEPSMWRSTTDESRATIRTPNSATTALPPFSNGAGPDSLQTRSPGSTQQVKQTHLPQGRRVSAPVSPSRTMRKPVSLVTDVKRANATPSTPVSKSNGNASTVRSPRPSQPITPILPTSQTTPLAPRHSDTPPTWVSGGGGRGQQPAASVIRARSISYPASAYRPPKTMGPTSPSTPFPAPAPDPSPTSTDRIVPGSGGRSAPTIDVLGRVNNASHSQISSTQPSPKSSSASQSGRPSDHAGEAGKGTVRDRARGREGRDGWTVVGGSTKTNAKSKSRTKTQKPNRGKSRGDP
ncbi:hypothetical protein IAU59_004708 [Kwoniella sp. CBS 9459]